MQKNTFKIIWNILCTIISLAVLVNVGILIYKGSLNREIKEYVSNELQLSPETIDGELKQLNEWANSFLVNRGKQRADVRKNRQYLFVEG